MKRAHKPERNRLAVARGLMLVLLTLVAASAHAFAQPPGRDGQEPPPADQRPGARAAEDDRQLMRALNLTPEQRAEIARLRRENEEQNRAVSQRIRQSRRALEEAIYAHEVDETLIEERAQAVATAEAARVRLRAQTELRIRLLLTPEQLNIFRELRSRAMRRARQNAQPGDPRRPRLPGPADAPGGRLEGQPPPAAPPGAFAPAPTPTPPEGRRARRNRRAPWRPLP